MQHYLYIYICVGAGGGRDGVGTHIATCGLGVRCRVPVVGGNIHTGVCV